MPPHLSETKLAVRWSISRRTLQRWRHLGVGPSFIRLQRRIVYPLAEVESFENANRTTHYFINITPGSAS